MAKNKKYSIGEVPEPTFDKQMEAYSEEDSNSDDPIFSSAYHKFMSNLLKTRDAAVKDELIEEVAILFIENNKTILGQIDDLLTKQTATVGRVVGEVMVTIENLDTKLSSVERLNRKEHDEIMSVLTDLKTRQDAVDEKIKKEQFELGLLQKIVDDHERRFEFKKKRIDSLEKTIILKEKEIFAKIKSIDDEIHGEIPIKLFKTYFLEKWIMAFIFAVLVSSLITFFSIRKHSRDVVKAGRNGNIRIENIQK